jgi:tetratricopeptide (TPR) repeat protein
LTDHESDAAAAAAMSEVQAALGPAYTLERELGGGGMSRVFVANEPSLGRRVVVKLLPPELTAGISAERFEREIRLAASLQQANIVPLLAAGRAGELRYYTMPFVEGRSLRDRLDRDGVLPLQEAVSVLRDVARALAYAHEHGVVHRDIKPGNVLLSGGTAVVTDFGIAKAISAARNDGGLGSLTLTGMGIGTPAYMAPEQATADPATDHRADVYAFGCLAYEIFTGKPPFHGRPTHKILAAHFTDVPLPLTAGRPDAPPPIAALVGRCLEKDPARRPQTASEILTALNAAEHARPVAWGVRGVTAKLALVAAFAAVAGGLWLYVVRGDGRTKGSAPSVATRNPAALAEYQLGEALVGQRGSGIKTGIEHLERAIVLDPAFAGAHAALATALELSPYFLGTPPAEVRDRATSEARRALELEPTLAEARTALGHVYFTDGRWDLAAPEFEQAIALEPNSLATRVTYGRVLLTRGEVRRATEQFAQARRIAPVSPLVSAWMSYALFFGGQTDAALGETARAFQLDSLLLPLTNLASLMNVAAGHNELARRLISGKVPAGVMSIAPYILAKTGDTAVAWKLIRGMESNDPRPWFTDAAQGMVFLASGDTARALDALERSARLYGANWTSYTLPLDPAYDPLRRSARFAELLRRAGLDTAVITSARR